MKETKEHIAAYDTATEDRLTMWATGNYEHERGRFPFGVYKNPPELRSDILSALGEIDRQRALVRDNATVAATNIEMWSRREEERNRLRAALRDAMAFIRPEVAGDYQLWESLL